MKNRQIKSKKVKAIIKKFDDDDQEEQGSQQEEQQISESQEVMEKKTKQSLKQILSKVLNKQSKSNTTILADKPQLLTQIKTHKQSEKELTIKKRLKKLLISKAHADPRMNNNKQLERSLKATAAKGIVKVFQVLKQAREEQEQE